MTPAEVPGRVSLVVLNWNSGSLGAAERRYMSVERVVPTDDLIAGGAVQTLKISRLMTDGVIEAPFGAHFTECPPDYARDEAFQKEYAANLVHGGVFVPTDRPIETFERGIGALVEYRENQVLLDLNTLPYDSDMPFSKLRQFYNRFLESHPIRIPSISKPLLENLQARWSQVTGSYPVGSERNLKILKTIKRPVNDRVSPPPND